MESFYDKTDLGLCSAESRGKVDQLALWSVKESKYGGCHCNTAARIL